MEGDPVLDQAPGTACDARRRLPRTDAVLADPRLAAAADRLGRDLVKSVVAGVQERARGGEIPASQIVEQAVAALPATACGLRPVVNATGVLLHTNLGRAPLSAAAREALLAAAGTTDVEVDLATGLRSRRGRSAVEALLSRVPSAQDAHVVNNGAAALVLAATALARGGDIVVSRGEMVEIGDGFRLPDLLQSTGARLREVGTTNRTALADYASAVGPGTGFVLKVHPSNFRITGFTRGVGVGDLSRLGVPVVADIGSGLLAPEPALPDEPDATTWLRSGAWLVTASGDKLLGGPQCGLLLGRADLVRQLARHPLARALRVDKLTLAALEATVRGPETPVRRALGADPGRLRERAERLAAELRRRGLDGRAVDSEAVIGGGGAPGVTLPSAAVSVPPSLAGPLRRGVPAVMGRVVDGRCLLDLRTVPEDTDQVLATAIRQACARPAPTAPDRHAPAPSATAPATTAPAVSVAPVTSAAPAAPVTSAAPTPSAPASPPPPAAPTAPTAPAAPFAPGR
ncbi:L-seryl-tRNA(Sec) selenium transferase [Streptomyces sulfonofaciens]|uniref:L-seryl-tRNA(Sec) selenium transferase n=1 Tax=Streptomyces sulfonofaciens TaxID=68272 RepID=A0A919L891_9ACTN|nr:L-seryl-tRNA(Sec) selenium transferase [Streptomyces sulfonofaciens]GHH87568.1 L-seryl-tRNA(Sec) selenium transferase [Streptomyces sulfonofaciens]